MDIRKPQQPTTEQSTQQPKLEENTFKTGTVNNADGKVLIPPALQLTLSFISKKYNLPLDLSNVTIGEGKLADYVKATRKIADMIEQDSKLLPELIKQTKRILAGEIKLAQFHVNVTRCAINHQEKLDKATADIFLMASGATRKASKLEHRVNVRNQLRERRTAAYASYYQNSVFGAESKIIDIEAEQLASDYKILTESKAERIKLGSERKQKLAEYVQSAYRD